MRRLAMLAAVLGVALAGCGTSAQDNRSKAEGIARACLEAGARTPHAFERCAEEGRGR